MTITYRKCPCGQAECRTYQLVGIGSFYPGSGFTLEEAQRIVDALNGVREEPPGHTDLMVTPESLDDFLEEHFRPTPPTNNR